MSGDERFAALCDAMASQVTDWAQGSAEIFGATIRAMGGGVGRRRLWRALARLVATNRVQRVGLRHSGARYVRALSVEEVTPDDSTSREAGDSCGSV